MQLDWHFARPELARHYLNAFNIGLVSGLALYARRRHGKTEFLTRDLTPCAQDLGIAVGYCNLWQGEGDPAEVIAQAVLEMAAPRKTMARIKAKLRVPVHKLKITGKAIGLGEGGAEVDFGARGAGERKKLPAAFAHFDTCPNLGLLLIDEAQVLADNVYQPVEKALRALLDTRKDRIKVVFTGSSEDRLRQMFAAEGRAFYNWASVEPLPLLGTEFALDLLQRANRLTTIPIPQPEGLRAFEDLNRVPELYRRFLSQYLAHPFEGAQAAVDHCRRSIYSDQGFAKRWADMLPADRLILKMVAAEHGDLHGEASLQLLGEQLGLGKPADRGVPQNALRRLRGKQILIAVGNGRYRFEDDTFREWVSTEANAG